MAVSTATLRRPAVVVIERRRALPAWMIVFLSALALYVGAAWYLTVNLGLLHNDAVARTAQAGMVVHGRDPHLAAIGFVWAPLPALVEIPLVAALRPVGLQAFAGGLQSAVSMALAATLVWSFGGLFSLGARTRALLTGLFVLNPMIVVYAATGMAEAMFFLFFVGTAYFFVRWVQSEQATDLAAMGLMTAGAFGVRYEALAVAAAGSAAIGVVWRGRRGRALTTLVADCVLYLTPIVYAILLWMWLSYSIVGDALYFLRGEYSAATLSANFDRTIDSAVQALREARLSPIATMVYVGDRLSLVFVAFLPLAAISAALALFRRSGQIAGVLLLSLSVAAFHALALHLGAALHLLRYYIDAVVGAVVLTPAIVGALERARLRWLAFTAISVALIVSSAVQVRSMIDQDTGREEYPFIAGTLSNLGLPAFEPDGPLPNFRTYAAERAVARYLDRNAPGALVLLDTAYGASIPVLSEHPERFVTTSDRDFSVVLARAEESVAYILVPEPTDKASLDRINRRYPELYSGGVSWAELERDWGGQYAWRLFRVTPGPSQ